jgi:hypothetical protein
VNGGAGIRVASHVQTRGSVPLLWGQPVTMRYNPKIVIDKDIDAADLAFKRHFTEQHRLYGRQVIDTYALSAAATEQSPVM